MPQLKLYYFGARARAELIRLLLAYADIPFEDIRVSREEWGELKSKMPFGVMPVLDIDGFLLSESLAIARYVAREYGLAGKTTWEQAQADMLMDGTYDCMPKMAGIVRAIMMNDEDEKEKQVKEFEKTTLNAYLERYNDFYLENDGNWFVGDTITWADIGIAEFLSNCSVNGSTEIIEKFPNLLNHMNTVMNLPQLQEYIQKRPATTF